MSVGLAQVQDALAAELGCVPADFERDGVSVVERPSGELPPEGVRRYPRKPVDFGAISFGAGCVVSASAAILPAVRQLCCDLTRDEVFEVGRLAEVSDLLGPHGLRAHGPHLRFLLGAAGPERRDAPDGIEIEITLDPEPERLRALGQERWPHTQLGRAPGRPARLLAAARLGSRVVGVATGAADTPVLCQIGIDVATELRGRGLGAALTARISGAILEADLIPYYGCDAANLPSQRTALAAGYRVAWAEAFTHT